MTERTRVVVAGAEEADVPREIDAIAGLVELRFAPTAEHVTKAIVGAEVVFAWRADASLLRPAWAARDALRWIQSASAGVDRLLFPELVDSDVVVTNAGGIFDEAIAEWAIGVMALFAKGLLGVLARQRERRWEHRDTEPLAGKRVLVAGVGGIGRAVARDARALGMEVFGLGRTARPGDGPFAVVFGSDELVDAVRSADYVVDALPVTDRTRRLFGAEVFAAMKRNGRFLNVGRGATVDEAALIDALRDGRIAGAALDVFEEEPLNPESPLWHMPNVVVSPHMSGDYAGWREGVVALFLENLLRFVKGEALRNVVDKRLGYPAGA